MDKKRALEQVASLSRRIAKGEVDLDSWKWRRAEAMATAADAGATQQEIAKVAGFTYDEKQRRSLGVQRHIAVAARYPSSSPRPPYSEAYDAVTGFDRDAAQARTDTARTKRTLTDAPLEQVEQIIAGLPKERQQAVAAAAGNAYLQARQQYADDERHITEAERHDRERAHEEITRSARNATAGFTALGIIGHLDQATEELRELNADSSVTPEMTRKIDRSLDAFVTEFRFARAMLGEEVG
jgi:hypothetical protein